MLIEEFDEVEVIIGNKKITWEYIGEGQCEYYNPDDPEDVPLLRFSCDEMIDGEWQQMDNASYCTGMPVQTPKRYLLIAAGIIYDAINTDGSYKKELEYLSHFCPDDFLTKSN